MIDELEDLAVEYIAERKYLDLLKKFSNENNTELIEMLEANRNAVSNFSEEKGSEEKRWMQSNSPYNTYIHLASTHHVRLRNLDSFWSQKRSVMPMVPRSPNLTRGEMTLKPTKKKG